MCTNFRAGLLHMSRGTGVERLKLVLFHIMPSIISQRSCNMWPFVIYVIMKAVNGCLMTQRHDVKSNVRIASLSI